MPGDSLGERTDHYEGPLLARKRIRMHLVHEQELGVHLAGHPSRKLGRRSVIHRNRYRPAHDASEKRGYPFRRVSSPEQNPVAGRNSTSLKFAGALRRKAGNLLV
jgi:hypothetical protein